jgi:hypothetical protein
VELALSRKNDGNRRDRARNVVMPHNATSRVRGELNRMTQTWNSGHFNKNEAKNKQFKSLPGLTICRVDTSCVGFVTSTDKKTTSCSGVKFRDIHELAEANKLVNTMRNRKDKKIASTVLPICRNIIRRFSSNSCSAGAITSDRPRRMHTIPDTTKTAISSASNATSLISCTSEFWLNS